MSESTTDFKTTDLHFHSWSEATFRLLLPAQIDPKYDLKNQKSPFLQLFFMNPRMGSDALTVCGIIWRSSWDPQMLSRIMLTLWHCMHFQWALHVKYEARLWIYSGQINQFNRVFNDSRPAASSAEQIISVVTCTILNDKFGLHYWVIANNKWCGDLFSMNSNFC